MHFIRAAVLPALLSSAALAAPLDARNQTLSFSGPPGSDNPELHDVDVPQDPIAYPSCDADAGPPTAGINNNDNQEPLIPTLPPATAIRASDLPEYVASCVKVLLRMNETQFTELLRRPDGNDLAVKFHDYSVVVDEGDEGSGGSPVESPPELMDTATAIQWIFDHSRWAAHARRGAVPPAAPQGGIGEVGFGEGDEEHDFEYEEDAEDGEVEGQVAESTHTPTCAEICAARKQAKGKASKPSAPQVAETSSSSLVGQLDLQFDEDDADLVYTRKDILYAVKDLLFPGGKGGLLEVLEENPCSRCSDCTKAEWYISRGEVIVEGVDYLFCKKNAKYGLPEEDFICGLLGPALEDVRKLRPELNKYCDGLGCTICEEDGFRRLGGCEGRPGTVA